MRTGGVRESLNVDMLQTIIFAGTYESGYGGYIRIAKFKCGLDVDTLC